MAYYNRTSTIPVGASCDQPEGITVEPTMKMETQLWPPKVCPNDEALMKSLYKLLLKSEWVLPSAPYGYQKEEYILPHSLTGNNIWIQRKDAFLRDNPRIDEKRIYIANKYTFLEWIDAKFNSKTVGLYGPAQDRCLIVTTYVLWVDKRDIGVQPPLDLPVDSDSGGNSRGWSYAVDTELNESRRDKDGKRQKPASKHSESSFVERVSHWQKNLPKPKQ
ncbi:hypothetical protein GGS21DRAFT_492081 [Xylaria nigripes]|nr:hypothetical protein GGS21DRAFT_492081 [Xylaria nigripes]